MENRERKTVALLITISTFCLALFGYEWPSISNLQFSWAYAVGIAVAMLLNMLLKFVKHFNSDNFQWRKLFWTHLVAFVLFCPISIILILPRLAPPTYIWKSDYMLAFLLTYFLINEGPKIAVLYENLDRLLEFKNGKKKDG